MNLEAMLARVGRVVDDNVGQRKHSLDGRAVNRHGSQRRLKHVRAGQRHPAQADVMGRAEKDYTANPAPQSAKSRISAAGNWTRVDVPGMRGNNCLGWRSLTRVWL